VEPWENYIYPTVNNPPNSPISLSQLRSDGTTEIPEGGTTPESTVVFKGTVSDPDGDHVRLEIELRRVEEPFIGEPTPETISDFVSSGTEVAITRYGLVTGNYKWQARVKDSNGATSEWMKFGVLKKDFSIWAEKGLSVSIEPDAPEGRYINKPINLTLTVTNPTDRTGININVYNVTLTLVEPDEIDFDKNFAVIGDISPGESKTAYFNGTMIKSGDNVEIIVSAEGDADLGRIRGDSKKHVTIHDPEAPKPNWSFAVITDLHIGYGRGLALKDSDNDDYAVEIDYDGNGFSDSGPGEDYEITERLENAVNTIIAEKDHRNIKFVVVLGDISDTAEKSEFLKGREILNKLNEHGIPYIPLIGNHDTWPYVQDIGPHHWWHDENTREAIGDRKHYANASIAMYAYGDRFFKEIFWESNRNNTDLIEELFGSSWKRDERTMEIEDYMYTFKIMDAKGNKFHDKDHKYCTSSRLTFYLQNYGFVYDNITFIALDLAPRRGVDHNPFNGEALPGAKKGAFATDHPQTLDFARRYFKEHPNDKVVLFSHYPTKRGNIDNYISESGKNLPIAAYWFGGHVHYNKEAKYEQERRKRYVILTEDVAGIPFKLLGTPIPAESGRGVRDGRIIRIVNITDSEINFSLRLKPPEPEIEWSWENALSTVPIIISHSYPEPNKETIFTAEYTPYYGFNTTFNWDFGDGNRASGFYVTHNYSQEGEYNVTLTINVTNLITNETRNNTIISSVYVHNKHAISSLPSDLNITSLITGEDLTQVPKNVYVPALISKNATKNIPIADVGVHFEEAEEDINLSALVADTNISERKSILYMPSWPDEIEESKVLYIPSTGKGAVYICKNATNLSEVSLENADLVINVGETIEGITVATTFYNDTEYYAVFNIPGTGGGEALSQHPFASFTYTPENATVDETITFNASSSYDPDGTIVSYEWDFGDGNITNTTHEILNHSYSEAGSYEVTLTVTDNDGVTNSTTKIIMVYPQAAIFDTGAPSNPYPSIAGTHNGTITPNQTIIVTKLYTYPCEGTGGHTEYARIWNKTWEATATWEGYAGDWHNITFDKTVVLLPNETYNYTIRTGSYPQIHHNTSLLTPNGWINCTKFTDANGRVYYDWIPAIKLWRA